MVDLSSEITPQEKIIQERVNQSIKIHKVKWFSLITKRTLERNQRGFKIRFTIQFFSIKPLIYKKF